MGDEFCAAPGAAGAGARVAGNAGPLRVSGWDERGALRSPRLGLISMGGVVMAMSIAMYERWTRQAVVAVEVAGGGAFDLAGAVAGAAGRQQGVLAKDGRDGEPEVRLGCPEPADRLPGRGAEPAYAVYRPVR